MSNQVDVAIRTSTNDSVTRDFENRARMDIDSGVNEFGAATVEDRVEHHSIFVCGGVTVDSGGRIKNTIQVGTTNLNTISIPSIVTVHLNRSYCERNLTTEADGSVAHLFPSQNFGFHDGDGIKALSFAFGSGLHHIDDVLVVLSRMDGEDAAGSTVDFNGITNVVTSYFRPSVNEVVSVVVNQVSSEGHLTTRTDAINAVGHLNSYAVVHIDIVRIAGNGAASFIVNRNGEDVRFISEGSVNREVNSIITDMGVRESPIIVEGMSRNCIIQISVQLDSTVVADNLVTRNPNGRIREYIESIGGGFADATCAGLANHHRVDVSSGITIESRRSVIDNRVRTSLIFNTISVPSVDVIIRGTIGNGNGCNGYLITGANGVGAQFNRSNGGNINSVDRDVRSGGAVVSRIRNNLSYIS